MNRIEEWVIALAMVLTGTTIVLASCVTNEAPEPSPEVELLQASKYVIDRRVEPPMCFLIYQERVSGGCRAAAMTAVPCQRLKGAPPKIIREIVFPEAYPPDSGPDREPQ